MAFLMKATPASMASVAAHPRVRWTGPYRPAHKFSADLMWVYGDSDQKPDEADGRTTASFENANVSFGSNAGTVTVTHRPTNRQLRLRDRNLANDPPCM